MIDHLDNTNTLLTIEDACNLMGIQVTSLKVIEANVKYKLVRCTFYKTLSFREFKEVLPTAFCDDIHVRTVEDWPVDFAALLSIDMNRAQAEVI